MTIDLYDDADKRIVRRRGGWFVTGSSWSGPWKTEHGAELARDNKPDEAIALERTSK